MDTDETLNQETQEKLDKRGYCACFAVGFDEAKKIIDEYLG
jgi:hypothetical protein